MATDKYIIQVLLSKIYNGEQNDQITHSVETTERHYIARNDPNMLCAMTKRNPEDFVYVHWISNKKKVIWYYAITDWYVVRWKRYDEKEDGIDKRTDALNASFSWPRFYEGYADHPIPWAIHHHSWRILFRACWRNKYFVLSTLGLTYLVYLCNLYSLLLIFVGM